MENDYPLFIISPGTHTECILKGLSGSRTVWGEVGVREGDRRTIENRE
jgi:hypothetical protein